MGDQADSGFLFQCAACGRQYSVSLARLPAKGARAPCKNCGKPITVYPDRRLEGAFPAAAPVSLKPGGPAKQTHGLSQRGAAQAGLERPPTAFIFPCPACSAPNEAALASVPPQGLAGRCVNCQSPFVLQSDGSIQLQKGRVASLSSPTQDEAWEVQLEGQTVGPFGLGEIRELARVGKLTAGTPVRSVGGNWATAEAFAALAPLFAKEAQSQKPPFGTENQCYAHPDSSPAFQCAQCARFLCQACSKDSNVTIGLKPLKLCPVCGGMVKPWTKPAKWRPFYMDLGQVFLAPLRGHALLYLVILAIVEVLKIPCWMAAKLVCFFILAVIFLNAFQWAFFLHVVKQVANGSYDFPEWPEYNHIGDMVWDFFKVLFVIVVSLIPVIIVGVIASAFLGAASIGHVFAGTESMMAILGPFIALVIFLGLLYAFYLPIPVSIVAVFDAVLPALNPVLVVRIISRIGPPYFAAYGLWMSFFVISIAVQRGLAAIPVPMLGAVLLAPVTVYIMLVDCYILGRLVHENEEKIGWR